MTTHHRFRFICASLLAGLGAACGSDLDPPADGSGTDSADASGGGDATSGSSGGTTTGPDPTTGGTTDDTTDESSGGESTGEPSDCEPPSEPITPAAVLDIILFDLNLADADERAFYRYFSLAHLYNVGSCSDQLESYRQGVSKLINALSTEAQIKAVTIIDQHEAILRIDIREYGWDEPVSVFADKWEALVANSPYAVEPLAKQAVTIKQLSQTNVPMLLGDAFINFASQPGAGDVALGNGTDVGYHEFAEVPSDVVDLQLQLGVDIDDNLDEEEVARAGYVESGPPEDLRLLHRHAMPIANNHALWLSYDFPAGPITEASLVGNPLDVNASGAMVIYSLPNGMHGYMLVGQDGARLDILSNGSVVDPNQEDGVVLNGVSCFGCHTTIFTEGPDQIRDYVLNNPDIDDGVASQYAPADEFAALVANDNEVFHIALQQAGVDPTSAIEPMTFVAHTFEKNVDLTLAAAELGVSEAVLLDGLTALDPALTPLTDGSIKRGVWTSLYADTICKLGLGLANDNDCS